MVEMPPVVQELRTALDAARYPTQWTVSGDVLTALEDYLCAVRDARIAEWKAAGSPADWPYDLWPVYSGPNLGVMFKGVEVCRA